MLKWFFISLCMAGCTGYLADLPIETCGGVHEAGSMASADEVRPLVQQLVSSGIPGVSLTVTTPNSQWSYAAGFSKIEEGIPMEICHLMYLQSVSKTYLSVAVLKLQEEGKIKLDQTMM
jgi:D-alanyl-D-alanine carboxypeptidase